MLEYLEKFNNLPVDVKQNISSGPVLATIESLEAKYGVPLASFVMRIMVGELYYKNITANLIVEYDMDAAKADGLEKELKEKVFVSVSKYLEGGLAVRAKAAPPVTSPFFINKNIPAAPLKEAMKPSTQGPIVRSAQASAPVKNFLEDDEKDIKAMGEKTASFKPNPVEKNEGMFEEIIKEASISFASAELTRRFKDIISTYLRGIRTKVEVKENLLKDVSFGGVKMDSSEADRILAIAQKKLIAFEGKNSTGRALVNARTTSDGTSFTFNKEEIDRALGERAKTTKSGIIDLGSRDTEYDLSSLSKKKPVVNASGEAQVVSLSGNIPKIVPPAKIDLEKKDVPALNKVVEEKKVAPIPQVKVAQPVPAAVIAPSLPEKNEVDQKRTVAVSGNKKRMEDIKLAPKLMSPIDELAYMDLVNFRRLDQSPARRIAKIEEKISLLEKEGIDKKIEGIRGWRNSPVNKTYLSMGQESIANGKNIDDIIKERKDQGLNYLSKEEFEAVMDLNDSLRF